MTAPMKRSVLATLVKKRLTQLSSTFDLDVSRSRPKAAHLDALVEDDEVTLEAILGQLNKDELEEICLAHDVPHRGRKSELVARLLGSSSQPAEQLSLTPVAASTASSARDEGSAKYRASAPETTPAEAAPTDEGPTPVEEGKLIDWITNEQVKDTPKEQVRQRVIRLIVHEYKIGFDRMARDFKVKLDGKRKKVDIAIFPAGAEHTQSNLERVVFCDKEPKKGSKGAFKMRDHEQAEKDFGLLYAIMAAVENCRHGLWTNGLEFFFVKKREGRFDTEFQPVGDWPPGDETQGSRTVASNAKQRTADKDMLLTTFKRCHNYIHGNEGMPKDAAFWQFLYLIFAKLHDERRPRDQSPRFWAGMFEKPVNGKRQLVDEQFDPQGQRAIRARIEPLFDEVREKYTGSIFRGNEEITLSDRALAFIVAELAKYDLSRTGLDAKGVAYQELVGSNLRGDRGQYFTPRGPIDLVVQMLDPQEGERMLDPACGTGGFLVSTLKYINERLHEEKGIELGDESTDEFLEIRDRLARYSRNNLFGADFDPFLARAAQMNVVMTSGGEARVMNMNSLEFPKGSLPGVEVGKRKAKLGSMDIVMTNPPFGSDIPITDRGILSKFELALDWKSDGEGGFVNSGSYKSKVAPEILFIERAYKWLKPGGRAGLVLPNGILGNPSDEYIRWWLLRHCWILASVELPVEVFIVEANVNILTSLLFIKRKTEVELDAWDRGQRPEYPVFMAVAEKVGFDRRGNVLYERSPDGEVLATWVDKRERFTIGGKSVERIYRKQEKIVDDDLPKIAKAYREFRTKHPEPGA